MRYDPGGSDLSLPTGLDVTDSTVPPGYRRKAGITVVENVPADEARLVLEMLGIGAVPVVRERGEPIG
jgi:CBS domain-containing protein